MPQLANQCRVEGCIHEHEGGGWCRAHYERFRKYGDPLGGQSFRAPRPDKCIAEGCDKKVLAKGRCSNHYTLYKKYGDHNIAKFKWHANGKNQWHTNSQGYVWRYAPSDPNGTVNGYVYQHRAVMAEKLGRNLLPGESVRHINGKKADNRPENLELRVTIRSQSRARKTL